MNDTVRVYPIRFSRQEWDIPLYCYHKCTERCSQIYQQDDPPNDCNYYLADNPYYINGHCPYSGQLRKSCIRIHSYNQLLPCIYEPENIVIPDKICYLDITFPLTTPLKIKLYSDDGFTIKNLLLSIYTLYKFIYEEEEITSTQVTYQIKKKCYECLNYDINDFISLVLPPKSDCCICYETYNKNEQVSKLECNHIFHTECIMNWCVEKNTCPLCRKDIIKCESCNGSRFFNYEHTGAEIPIYMRGSMLNRNNTDGLFGIYFYDFEDLLIQSMKYNRITKILQIKIVGG